MTHLPSPDEGYTNVSVDFGEYKKLLKMKEEYCQLEAQNRRMREALEKVGKDECSKSEFDALCHCHSTADIARSALEEGKDD